MKDAIYLLFHMLTTLAKLIRPSGGRAVPGEFKFRQPLVAETDRGNASSTGCAF
jgi:hypothetical protein